MVAPVSSEPVRLLIKKDFCGKKTSADIINVSLARKTTWEPPFIINKNNQSKVTFIIIIISFRFATTWVQVSYWLKSMESALDNNFLSTFFEIRTVSKPRRRRQRGREKTKDLIGRTIAQHVCFKTLYISWPSYAKQQREITTICVVCELKPRRQIILISIWNSTLPLYVKLKLSCGAVWDGKHMQPFLNSN